ncbi:MAG: hypothetical protein FJ042_08310, partial [Candidatus Cloacimonetes bacterium]|nr:hypothetical protein [Candidatus Cloacimonadota bacterium]
MRRVIFVLIGLFVLCNPVFGSVREEAIALNSWMSIPFSASALEVERDALIAQQSNPVKGEFETTAQFEQRKKDATARIAALRAEYEQKIRDARSAHEAQVNRMRQRMQALLAQSRETVERSFTLGAYDADSQMYKVTVDGGTVKVIVPLAVAPLVRNESGRYKLSVTRQLDENLQYVILEARLSGPAGTFASTGTAPGISAPVTTGIIPPDLRALIAFNEPSGNNMLDAEETAQVKITVENSGKGGAFMVEARLALSGVSGITLPATVYIGEVKAGQKAERTVELTGGQNLATGEAVLKITFSEQNGFQPDDVTLRFPARAMQPPDLVIADVGIVDANRDGVITPGEAVEVKVRIQNRGRGVSRKVVAEVVLGADVFLYGASPQREFTLGELQPGQYKDIEFNIVTNKNAQALNLSVNLREERSQFSRLAQPLNLAFNRRERTADQMVITGIDQWAQIT